MSNSLRIIGGSWRSRIITFKDAPGLRPTPSRVRETLFNWLRNDIPGSHCLDLFAGSGALGFEALSRGAKRSVFVDSNPDTCRELRLNQSKLKSDSLEIITQDSFDFIRSTTQQFDIIFVDPPFRDNLATVVCMALANSTLVHSNSIIYVETAIDAVFSPPESWLLLKQNSAGEVQYSLFTIKDSVKC